MLCFNLKSVTGDRFQRDNVPGPPLFLHGLAARNSIDRCAVEVKTSIHVRDLRKVNGEFRAAPWTGGEAFSAAHIPQGFSFDLPDALRA
ncbi:hypothetical protein [Anaeromassilibacillus senegalensis]|uniref:hypothetical protein n=1 Tax=Anaeromassilibacillus senegalensis TaxID=1673717 RepID=UPI000681A977|nr:hypothetical protein [Anaeromassilibacillus senegalensis]